ncbi:MAG: gliding motility protein GldN, partial [Prevotella sp.]|nr:gliding motility protein GldN [Prevotella sp.]
TILDNYHIFYEMKDGKVRVDNSDIPSAEVKLYYLKESAYFDESNSTFRRKVLAFCPIMVRDDDFGGEPSKYPLFWVKYSDVASYLSRQMIQASSTNNAAVMSIDDYFTLTRYDGKIYKTNNLLGRTLAQYCPTDEDMAKEQKKIEKELSDFQKNLYGDQAKKDYLDSIAKLDPKLIKEKVKKSKSSRRSSSSSSEKVKKAKAPKSTSSGGGGAARVSVRRERH